MSLFNELKRRNVFRVGAAYLVVAWLLIQIVDTLSDMLAMPDSFGRGVLILLAIGFPVALIISWIYEITPTGVTTQEVVDAGVEATSGRKLNAIIIGGLALALVLVVLDSYVFEESVSNETVVVESDTEILQEEIIRTAELENSIAVMRFRDLSPTQDQTWLAEGVPVQINNQLTSVPELRVINTNSSFQLGGDRLDYNEVRNLLQVNYILTGSVIRVENQLRMSVQLSRTTDGQQLWSANYDNEYTDLLNLQDEISERVASALQIRLGTGFFGQNPGMTRNPDAYEEYLKGSWRGRGGVATSIPELRDYLQHLEAALVIDPNFSVASGELYFLHTNYIPFFATENDFPESASRAERALEHIRSVDPEDPLLLVLESDDLRNQGDWITAELKLLEAKDKGRTRLMSADIDVDGAINQFNFMAGRVREAIQGMERGRAADPFNTDVNGYLASALSAAGNHERALAVLDNVLARPGLENNIRLTGGRLLATMAMEDKDAIRNYRQAFPTDGINGAMIANVDNPEAALAIIRENAQSPDVSAQGLGVFSLWAAWYDDPQLALDLLLQSQMITNFNLGNRLSYPVMAEARRLEDFKLLTRRMGLADYWITTGNWPDYCRPLEGNDDFECF